MNFIKETAKLGHMKSATSLLNRDVRIGAKRYSSIALRLSRLEPSPSDSDVP